MDLFDLDDEIDHELSMNSTGNESINMSHYDQASCNYNQHNHHIKRDPSRRIFVNRSFQLSDIKFYGFDMDHTLAVYNTAEYDVLIFELAIQKLIQMGYPKELAEFRYDPKFAVRGLWYDKLHGNLLKVDPYGNIIICVHGFNVLKGAELYRFYPNKFIQYDKSRIEVQHTLYEMPETYLLACIIDFFSNSPDYKCQDSGVSNGDVFISYKAIYQDVHDSIDFLYRTEIVQKEVTKNTKKYIVKDDNLKLLLKRIKENNAKTFLLTNSSYSYADVVMGYMLNDEKSPEWSNWRNYFDYIVVDAGKPLFFQEGTTLKEINIQTKQKNIGSHSGPILSNRVYSGGNCDVFAKLIGSHGKDVLYVGDHIFGDIIKSKKERAWHTFLIVPELRRELLIWHEKRDLYAQIEFLNDQLSQMFINYDSTSKSCPDITNLKDKLQSFTHELDMSYSFFGSAFRTGSSQTYFASQVSRYADIYAFTCLNLLYYPFFYLFKSAPMLMPHESTVNPEEPFTESNHYTNRAPSVTENLKQ